MRLRVDTNASRPLILLIFDDVVINYTGTLDVPDGTTLRTHLSSILNCDPMRITKKFTGDSCIGKRIFQPLSRCDVSSDIGNNFTSSSSSSSAPPYSSTSVIPVRADAEENKDYRSSRDYDIVSESVGLQVTRLQNTNINEDSNINDDNDNRSSSSNIGGGGISSASARNIAQDGPTVAPLHFSHSPKQIQESTRKSLENSDINTNININSIHSSNDACRISSSNIRTPNSTFIDNSRKELRLLRRTWLEKMLSSEREMARKNVKSASSAKLNSGKIKVRNCIRTHKRFKRSKFLKILF